MSSNTASSAGTGWSLTRRMAVTFALANGLVLVVYTVVLAVEVMSILRGDVKSFLEHELTELSMEIAETDGSVEAIKACVEDVAAPTGEPDCGLRVRDADGNVIVRGGVIPLLDLVPEPIPENVSWRSRLLTDGIALKSMALGERRIEIVADASEPVARIKEFFETAVVVFLAAAVVTGLTGWFTAHRGLRSLRLVVDQARVIRSPTDVSPIAIDDAPREVREVGHALNGMLERLQETLDRMRAFTAGLAHELRSPLQNLIGETEVTLMSLRSPEEYRDVLRSNLEDLYDLTDAVDNLVTFCRTSEPASAEPQTERFDLAGEAELRLAREQRVAERKGVTLEFASEGDARVDADRESCLRVLRNLVANAIIWTPAGRTVRVRVEGREHEVAIVVDDEGPGVSEELGDRIFEPFVTGQSRRGKRGGYGLGLAICRSVADDHGGSLTYESLAGGGARFVATFPRAARAPGVVEPSTA